MDLYVDLSFSRLSGLHSNKGNKQTNKRLSILKSDLNNSVIKIFFGPSASSLAQVPSVACAGVGPVQPGDSVSWPVWWLPVRVPGPWCGPEVQEGQTHRPEYVAATTLVSRANLLTRCVPFWRLASFPPVPPDDPVIDGGPEVLLNAGESYNLSCVSRGAKPPSIIEWLKDGLPVEGAVSATVSSAHKLRVADGSFAIRCSDRVCCSAAGGAFRQKESDDAELPAHPARQRRHREELQLRRHQPGCSHRQEHNRYPQCAPWVLLKWAKSKSKLWAAPWNPTENRLKAGRGLSPRDFLLLSQIRQQWPCPLSLAPSWRETESPSPARLTPTPL